MIRAGPVLLFARNRLCAMPRPGIAATPETLLDRMRDGDDPSGWSPRRRARAIGYGPQSRGGQFPFTVREMVLMGLTAHRGAFEAPRAEDRRIATPPSTGSASERSPSATGRGSAAASGSSP